MQIKSNTHYMKARKRLASLSELSYLKVARRMRIAIQIADAMEAQHISKKELACKMGRQPSEITKWLSGDQNFTSDTLAELSYYLHAKITGEAPDYSVTYLTFLYNQSLTMGFPNESLDFPISSRRRWKELPDNSPVNGN